MRYREFLFEYNRDITKKNFGDKLVMALKREFPRDDNWKIISDEGVKRALIDSYIESFENADPTPNKEYVQWMVRKFVDPKNMVKYEDYMGQLPAYLKKFHKLKQRRMLEYPRSDINKYEDVPNFMNVIDEYPDPERQESGKELKGNATEFYEDNDLRIIVPQDQNAACYYGRGTRWCTAATVGQNFFNSYSARGPLYIIIPKRPEHNGEKYQFSFAADQFMDESDDTIDNDRGNKLGEKYPQLGDIFKNEIQQNQSGYFLLPQLSDEEFKSMLNYLQDSTYDMPNGSHVVYLNDFPDIEGLDTRKARVAEMLMRRAIKGTENDWDDSLVNDDDSDIPNLVFAIFNKDYTAGLFVVCDINNHDISWKFANTGNKEMQREVEQTYKSMLKTMTDYRRDKWQLFDLFNDRFVREDQRIPSDEI